MTKNSDVVIFNSELEAGIRALILLNALFPASIDLHRIVQFEYLMVHSGDIDGPSSLHPPIPLRSGELLIRRGLLERGLNLMMGRGLIKCEADGGGFEYSVTETSSPFVKALTARYNQKLIKRAEWVADNFTNLPSSELSIIMKSFFENWTTEFHTVEHGQVNYEL